jgi:hypothetical protein
VLTTSFIPFWLPLQWWILFCCKTSFTAWSRESGKAKCHSTGARKTVRQAYTFYWFINFLYFGVLYYFHLFFYNYSFYRYIFYLTLFVLPHSQEIAVLSQLEHENIVRYIGTEMVVFLSSLVFSFPFIIFNFIWAHGERICYI